MSFLWSLRSVLVLCCCWAVNSHRCVTRQLDIPQHEQKAPSSFLESHYGHWSTAHSEHKNGVLRIILDGSTPRYMDMIDDQGFWLFIWHRRYFLEYIEVHSRPASTSRPGLELRLVHKRMPLYGDDLLLVSIFLEKATSNDEETSSALQWLADVTGGKLSDESCTDAHKGSWVDSINTTCPAYEKKGLCTSRGETGPNWINERPDTEIFPFIFLKLKAGMFYGISDYARNGLDAREACCTCGGGGFKGLWSHLPTKGFSKFEENCGGTPTTWVVMNSSLRATQQQFTALESAAAHAASEERSPDTDSPRDASRTWQAPGMTTSGKLIADDARFVLGAQFVRSGNGVRMAVLGTAVLVAISMVLVMIMRVMSKPSVGDYTAVIASPEMSTSHCSQACLFVAVCLRWIVVVATPIYAYAAGLVMLEQGFPWEVHCIFLVTLCILCVFQLHALISSHTPANKHIMGLACLANGALAIIASYLELSILVMICAVLDPLAYTNREVPSVFLAKVGAMGFIYTRLIFGFVAGVIGACARLGAGRRSDARAIFAFRNNLELVGFIEMESKEDKLSPPSDPVPICFPCQAVWLVLAGPGGWICCIAAVLVQTLTAYLFYQTSGRQSPILWASIAVTYLQHGMRASGFLPSVQSIPSRAGVSRALCMLCAAEEWPGVSLDPVSASAAACQSCGQNRPLFSEVASVTTPVV